MGRTAGRESRGLGLVVLTTIWITSLGLSACSGREDAPAPKDSGASVVVTPGEPVRGYLDLRAHQVRALDLLAGLVADPSAELFRARRVAAGSLDSFVIESTGEGNAHVEWGAEFAADDAFEIEFEAINDRPCVVRFFWRREGEAFDFSRHVSWPMPEPGKQVARRMLRGAPGFVDEIVEVRLQIEAPHPVRLAVGALATFGWPSDFGVDRVAEDPLDAIRMGSEVRPAFLLAPGEVRTQPLPAGRWRLRGAAVHAGSRSRALSLKIERGGEVVDATRIEIDPVAPAGQTVLWNEVFWDVDLDVPASLVYGLGEDDQDAAVVVAAVRALPRDTRPSPRAVLVSLDTVRADILGLYGAEGDPSPALDAWAEAAIVFDQAYSTSSWTLPSHVSMLTGFWPTRHGVEGGSRVYPISQPSLAKALRGAGFWTEAWTEGGFVDARFGHSNGFDRYVVLPSNHMLKEGVEGSLDSLARTSGPSFLFLHSYEAHAPYHPDPDAFARYAGRSSTEGLPSRSEMWAWMEAWRSNGERLPQAQLDLLFAAYRAGILRVDRRMARFLSGLEDLPAASSEIVAVTSDHGDVFQERTHLLEHGQELQPELLRVPLVIRTHRPEDRGRRAEIASIADVPATFLSFLGLPPIATDGRALLRDGDGDGALAGRDAVEAAVQPPYEAAYRIARITPEQVDRITLEDQIGVPERMTLGEEREPLGGGEGEDVARRWSRNLRGRTELAVRFEAPRGKGVIDIESHGAIRDAVLWPSVGAVLERIDDRHLRVRLVAAKPTAWFSVALETDPPATGLRVAIPASLGEMDVFCGEAPYTGDSTACAAGAASGPAAAATFASSTGGRAGIVHHPGEPFLNPGSAVLEGTASASVDAVLAAQLEALGYGAVAAELPTAEAPVDSAASGREMPVGADEVVFERVGPRASGR